MVLTDVILTGALTGRDVAERCRAVRPRTPILYTSGYARDAIVHNDRLDDGIDLLAKPFTMVQLASHLRAVLDRERPR